MKLTAIFLVVCFQVSARGFSQTVTLSLENASLEQVFNQVKKQTGLSFIWDEQMLKVSHTVNIRVKDAPVLEVMDLCLEGQPLTYQFIGKIIVISQKPAPADRSPAATGESLLPIDIKGRLINEKGDPIEGATVTVKGAKAGIVTDANGEFALPGVEANAILIFTAINIERTEIKLNGRQNILINVKTKVSSLDELQVIAYGTVSKRLNTGSVSTVKAEDIGRQPVTNPLAAIEGRMPGVLITQQTGLPGGGFKVQIRGQNSLRKIELGDDGNDPLYIIDGVPYISGSLQQLAAANGTPYNGNGASPLNLINPSNIESIDVLKDADATAIYGSRGANGVILITTKKGKAGKAKVNLNVYKGWGKATRTQKFLNLRQYLDMRYEAFKNDDAVPQPYDYDLVKWDTTRYTDWQKMLIGGTAQYTNAQFSISGGNTNTQFLIGAGYSKETTILPKDFNNQNVSVHFNLTHSSDNQKFKTSFTGDYSKSDNHIMSSDVGSAYITAAPDAPPVYDSSGKLNWADGTFDNPFAQFLNTYTDNTYYLSGNALISYQLFPFLQIKANLGYNQSQKEETQLSPISSFNPAYGMTSGISTFGNNRAEIWTAEPEISYNQKLGQGQLTVLIGATFQENTFKSTMITATGFTSDDLLGSLSAAGQTFPSSGFSEYRYNAVFGRINYNWQDKYLLNITGRRDGSSRFGPDKQFANFAAAGLGWIFSKERFFSNSRFLSFGKLRASYGSTGSDQIGNYGYLASYRSTGIAYQGIVGLLPARLYNPDYSWEITRKLEVAAELGFAKDRILLTVSWYRNRSSNQLVGYPLSTVTGFSTIQSNRDALVQNTGLEFTLNTTNIKNGKFTWTTSLNLSIPRSKLISFPNIENTSYKSYYVVGESMFINKGPRFAGVDQQTGIYQFYDSHGGLTSSPVYPVDYQYVKRTGVDFYGGIQNAVQYKNWQLDFHFYFIKKIDKNNVYGFYAGSNSGNVPAELLNRWQKPGDVTGIQRFNQDYSLYNASATAGTSDAAFTDASFIRLRNLSLSYQLPAGWIRKAHLQYSRIYIQAQNLLTITKYKGLDPETLSVTPPLRVITAGIQVTF